MIVVVGGQCRKAGKTTAVCDIVAATREARWTALKISPHPHEPGASADPDTDRYLRAGAIESNLLTSVPEDLPNDRNYILETNQSVQADLIVFIAHEDPNAEWKDSAHTVAARAGFHATGRLTPKALRQIAARIIEQKS